MAHITILVGCLALLTALFVKFVKSRPPKGYQYVPGPKGLPLLGHTTLLHSEPQAQLRAWARTYGPVFRLRIGWNDWIFVTEPGAIKEIFDKNSRVTSGRPPFPVVSDLISGGKRVLFMSYTERWRNLRTIIHKLLTPKMSSTFKPSQNLESKQLLYDIFQDTKSGEQGSFYMHIRRYTTSVIMTSTYGRRIPKWVSLLSAPSGCKRM